MMARLRLGNGKEAEADEIATAHHRTDEGHLAVGLHLHVAPSVLPDYCGMLGRTTLRGLVGRPLEQPHEDITADGRQFGTHEIVGDVDHCRLLELDSVLSSAAH